MTLKYITKQFDQFRNLTVIRHKKNIACGGGIIVPKNGVLNLYEFQLRQVKSKDFDAVLLDCEIRAEDWFHARNGSITFNCDQENTSIKYEQSKTDVRHIGKTAYCFEYGHYELTPDQLKAICTCSTLMIQIAGAAGYERPAIDWCAKFQEYCRQFYSEAIEKLEEAPPTASSSAAGEQKTKFIGRIVSGLVAGVLLLGLGIAAMAWWDRHNEKSERQVEAVVRAKDVAKAEARPTEPQVREPAGLPSIEKGVKYAVARQQMLAAGWTPWRAPDAQPCSESDAQCKSWPELESCAGTGLAPCRFLWRREGETVAVVTLNEVPVFNGFQTHLVYPDAVANVPTSQPTTIATGADPAAANPLEATTLVAPTAPPAIEPTAALGKSPSPSANPSNESVTKFITRWMAANSSAQRATDVLPFYAPEVTYYARGLVDKRYIETDKSNFFARWPTRHNKINEVTVKPASVSGDILVSVRYTWEVENGKQAKNGSATAVVTLRDVAGQLLIVKEFSE